MLEDGALYVNVSITKLFDSNRGGTLWVFLNERAVRSQRNRMILSMA